MRQEKDWYVVEKGWKEQIFERMIEEEQDNDDEEKRMGKCQRRMIAKN